MRNGKEEKMMKMKDKIFAPILNNTPLSNKAKTILATEAEELYLKINNIPKISGRYYDDTEIQKAALYLACDNKLCALPRTLPKPKHKYLRKVRKALKIRPTDAIDRVDSICNLLNLDENVSKMAKELLLEYSKQTAYLSYSPTIIAGSAIYIAAILNNTRITKIAICKHIGVSEISLGKHVHNLKLAPLNAIQDNYEAAKIYLDSFHKRNYKLEEVSIQNGF